jgi:hypothetical protein
VLGARIARAPAGSGEVERLRRYSRWISIANLVLGILAIYLAASLAS